MSRDEKKKVDTTVLVAIIGLVGTLAAAILSSPVLIKLIERTPPPAATPTPGPTATPVVAPTGASNAVLVFSEDFNDGNASGFTITGGSWQVRKIGGETFFEGSGNGGVLFGPPDMANGTLSFQFRFAKESAFFVALRFSPQEEYRLTVDGRNDRIEMAYRSAASGIPQPIAAQGRALERGVWYPLTIQMNGPEIAVRLADELLFTARDERLTRGGLMVGLDSGESVQLDNLLIWRLDD